MKLKRIFLLTIFFLNSAFAGDKPAKDEIASILNRMPKSTLYGLLVINPLTEDTIISINPSQSFIPASNTKLFTSAVAVHLLGVDFECATKFFSTAKIENGIIDGDLIIKGYGNALMSDNDLDSIAEILSSNGLKKINGRIIGDDTFFDDEYSRQDWIEDDLTNVKLAPVSALVLNGNKTSYQKKYRRRIRTYYTNVGNPPLHIANEFKKKLVARGIEIAGTCDVGSLPANSFLLVETKVKLLDILKPVNKNSNNFIAECLFKLIGAQATAGQGTAFNAGQTVNKFLKDFDVYTEGTTIIDGSGLSRYNKTSVGTIVSLLEKIYLDLDLFEKFTQTLSIAGADGTLSGRMKGSNAEFNFMGKTGTLNGASSLSGYLKTKNGDDLIVSMIFEFSSKSGNYYRSIQDEIVKVLAEYEE